MRVRLKMSVPPRPQSEFCVCLAEIRVLCSSAEGRDGGSESTRQVESCQRVPGSNPDPHRPP